MKMKKVLPLSLAGAMAIALTACNLNGLPTKTAAQEGTIEGTVKPSIGKATGGSGDVATNPNLANIKFAKPNATVQGQLLDTKGAPIADAVVMTSNGQVVKTDAQGNYSIAVTAEDGKEVVLIYQKDGYVFSSERVTMKPGETATVDGTVKQLDKNVVSVTPEGGTYKNSTGVLEVDIPKGALTGTGNMVMTPLAFGAGTTDNELPGPLETVDENGERLLLMPAEYWSIDLAGVTLKEGESMTMRMKLPPNPLAPVQLKAGDMIPCYIYDAELGYWNSPNLGPVVEKDGELWATYEIKASALTNRADVARTVQHYYYGSRNNPLSDPQLQHNASHEGEGGNSFGVSVEGGGVIGGHTYYNLFGTRMTGLVKDEKGNALNGVSVSIRGTTRSDNMTTSGGAYGSLQYRGESAKVKAVLNAYCQEEKNLNTAAHNYGPFPPNQFGFAPAGRMEQRSPVQQAWPDIVLDTRHPAEIKLNSEVKGVSASQLKYTLNGKAITYAQLTAKNLDRGVAYTLEATLEQGDGGVGQAKFTIPQGYEKGKPFAIDLALNTTAVK